MFGINTVSADDIDTNNLIVDNLIINTSGTAPTVDSADDSTNIATTAWVIDHADQNNLKYVPSTGVFTGGKITIVSSTTYSITDGTGVVYDTTTRVATPVSWSGYTNVSIVDINNPEIYISIDSTGSIVETYTHPSNMDARSYLYLGHFQAISGALEVEDREIGYVGDVENQLHDLVEAFGGILKPSGNKVSANSGTLQFTKSAGTLYGNGINFHNDVQNPNEETMSAINTTTDSGLNIDYVLQDGTLSHLSGPPYNIDPDNYDNGGLQTVPNNKWTIQRMYLAPGGNILIQYGQNLYNNKALAEKAIFIEDHVEAPEIYRNYASLCYLILKRNTTDLASADNAILNTGLLAGVTSQGVTEGTLQSAYDNSTSQPQITLDHTTGSGTLQIKGTSGSTDVFQLISNADAELFTVQNDGEIVIGNSGPITFDSYIHIEGNSNGRVCIGRETECSGDNQVSLGYRAGYNPSGSATAINSICIGTNAGANLPANANANTNVLIGASVFSDIVANSNRAYNIVAIGNQCMGYNDVASGCNVDNGGVAIGTLSAYKSAGQYGVYLGYASGGNSSSNGDRNVAIGHESGYNGINNYSIAIGYRASYSSNTANSICLNASGSDFGTSESGFYVNPVRKLTTPPSNHKMMCIDTDTNELVGIDTDDHGLLSANNTWTGENTFTNKIICDTFEGEAVSSDVNIGNNVTTGDIVIGSGLTTGFLRLGSSSASAQVYINSQLTCTDDVKGNHFLAQIVNGNFNVGTNITYVSGARAILTVGSSASTTKIQGYDTTITGSNSTTITSDNDVDITTSSNDINLTATSGDIVASGDVLDMTGIVPRSVLFPVAYMVNTTGGKNDYYYPITVSIPDYSDWYDNASGVGTVTVGSAVTARDYNDIDNYYIVAPGYQLKVYTNTNYGGTNSLDYTNTTSKWRAVTPAGWTDSGSSCRVYLNGNEIS